MNTQTLEHTCAHEAGHAAMCMLLGVPVRLVTAIADETTLGSTHHDLGGSAERDDLATRMKIILGGLIESAQSIADLPAWPLDSERGTTDQRRIALLAKALGLDEDEYRGIIDEALELWDSPEYKRLHVTISHLLEQHGQLDYPALKYLKAIVLEEAEMQHMVKTATATTTDEGIFEAIVATWDLDRDNDIIHRGAFAKTIREWRDVGRMVPLHWNHSSNPDDIIGEIDPRNMEETSEGLVVTGHVDLDLERGKSAWRLMKRNAIAFSFGYLVTSSHDDHKGTQHILEIDVFEISAVPAPANNRTRLLSTKTVDGGDLDQIRTQWRDQMLTVMAGDAVSATKSTDSLRAKADRLAREYGPIQTASFEC